MTSCACQLPLLLMALFIRPSLLLPTQSANNAAAAAAAAAAASNRHRLAMTKNTSMSTTTTTSSVSTEPIISSGCRKLPILLFDVMDTLVRDPFYHDVPAFFRMTMKELMEVKHPTAWLEFEKGLISETELAKKFFKDGRPTDVEGLKECMRNGYHYVDGIEELLHGLMQNHYEIHAFTNYPIWYTMIEDKLKLSTYLSWTFCSCHTGKRKPAHDSFLEVSHRLGVEPANCIFIDDRLANVEAARSVGMIGLHFKDAASLRQGLYTHGVVIQVPQR